MDDGDFETLGGIEEQSVPDLLRDVRFDPDKTLVSQIFEIIRRLIITVRLRPGQKISENDISEELTASKNPVREALIRLEDAGLGDRLGFDRVERRSAPRRAWERKRDDRRRRER